MSVQYPTWRYHAEHPPRIVKDELQDRQLGEGWFDSPTLAVAQTASEEAQVDSDAQGPRRGRPRKQVE